MSRFKQAKIIYDLGMERVENNPAPRVQKFPVGARVRISDDLGSSMRHFNSSVDATVEYTYDHAYGGGDVKSYCLNLDGIGSVSWYMEHQLTLITNNQQHSGNL